MHIDDILEAKIIRLNNEGLGVALINKFVVFVKNALVDELVKIKITEVNDNYAKGEVINYIKTSSDRVIPLCPFYEKCGGCNLMHMNYESQINFKKDKVKSIFKKISNIDIDIKDIIYDKEYNYRNKVTLKVKNDKIGLYREKTNDIINVDKCLLLDNKINDELIKLELFIHRYKNNNISEIMIRVINDKIMLSLDTINKEVRDSFINNFDHVESIYINNKLVYGNEFLKENINDLEFNISPKSFFQVNKNIMTKMYNKAISYIKGGTTLDLYSGTGTLSMLASISSKEVIGIEVVKDAVKDANNNIELNNIKNVSFICDKVENKIEDLKNKKIDNIIMDPPRSGSDKKSLNSIIEIEPKQIIYISCNPVTLARDYNTLREKYNIKEITLFDMFPNTYHVECVLVLSRKTL
ncbi:MAG: 23S rRNA (uracil(1939)-C(5))-methyltransferase RlmD [Bacilli bacterium]|nr:23S rRNA (uracil(1939)-C(5))-methyltransferase RlmD [Bacilli bacterium]